VPSPTEFQYTVLRLVPSLERGERINVGVVVFCRQLDFLQARSHVDEARLAALAPGLDAEEVRPALQAICHVVAGDPGAGPLAALPASERFGWVVAHSSTIIQPSPSHTGLTEDPAATLERLFATLVLTPAA
jgi:Protein of unknown function (DUF3037)